MKLNNLINTYIKRILIDYPEEDKLYLDLYQFANEVLQLEKINNQQENNDQMLIILKEQLIDYLQQRQKLLKENAQYLYSYAPKLAGVNLLITETIQEIKKIT